MSLSHNWDISGVAKSRNKDEKEEQNIVNIQLYISEGISAVVLLLKKLCLHHCLCSIAQNVTKMKY